MNHRKTKRLRSETRVKQSRKYSNSREKLDEQTIMEAISGEPLALMRIVKIYEPYINKLSLRMVTTEDGDYKEQIDETVKKTLETSLIAAIIKFDPCIQKKQA
ncbi:helix-turn-helix domain-containing protein [Anaerotignum lactatifermentans]|jgi:hypothetical protein|uniref:helix-turn-helix domain-containing protein n=1 Tax=Anaerotignum lactatifermentans TaxID=160404 RepID=UPI0024302F6A|nr:helix-turn-helix domain-containing protein [Anaerotignum lactatifermentans]